MKRFIEVKPQCGTCGGSLEIEKYIVNLATCSYEIYSNCIMCGEENVHILALADFIEIGQILGGQNEPPQN